MQGKWILQAIYMNNLNPHLFRHMLAEFCPITRVSEENGRTPQNS